VSGPIAGSIRLHARSGTATGCNCHALGHCKRRCLRRIRKKRRPPKWRPKR
jgi:hypothetical protein